LERLAAVDRTLVPAPAELARVLHDLEVRAHDDPRPGLVAITSPRALRARRVRAAFLCGLREDAFPRPATPEPFLGDDERRALNAASGLRLRLREDRLDAERYLLYAVVSRPTELLALSWPRPTTRASRACARCSSTTS
jgi:ATP-dependent helicase/DNAse subunit B